MGTYYLGTHHPEWLWTEGPRFPMCVSRHSLTRCKRPGRALVPWILDSGGYTVLSKGNDGDPPSRWPITAEQYVAEVARWAEEIGNLVWAAPMDHMCEPWVLRRTGRTVDEHQRLTVENYLQLCELWPRYSSMPCPFIPVLQGWSAGSYMWCIERYQQAGVDLAALPTVGLGSVCRRKSVIQIAGVVTTVSPLRLHGFGFKIDALAATASRLVSADSLSWSLDARYNDPLPGHAARHKRCNNCREYAASWWAALPLERYGWDDSYAGDPMTNTWAVTTAAGDVLTHVLGADHFRALSRARLLPAVRAYEAGHGQPELRQLLRSELPALARSAGFGCLFPRPPLSPQRLGPRGPLRRDP